VIKNFKKADLIINLNKNSGFSLNFSKKLINDLINILVQNIKLGNLTVKNLGTFKILNKKKRPGRNPKTKENFIISARKTVKFVSSQKLLKSLNYE
tara:strand:+ start:66 stop:353 length:288 start_codon:yes stop_codon:yes gene_type:complete